MAKASAAITLAVVFLLTNPAMPAAAAPLTPVQRHHVADMQHRAAVGTRLVRGDSALIGGPKLTALGIGASVDAASMDAQLRIDLAASDKISDLNYLSVTATSPDGLQQVSTGYPTGFPTPKVTAAVGLNFNYYHAPGTWNVTQVVLYDVAGNSIVYDQAALAKLGPTAFTVNNDSWRRDTSPPVASAGKVLTPALNVHDAAAFAGVQYTITDGGSPKSGPYSAGAQFCTLDLANCIYLSQALTYAGLAKATVKPATQLYAGYPAGVYHLYVLYSTDWAGNGEYLTGIEFGGETDFSTLFPNGHTITVVN